MTLGKAVASYTAQAKGRKQGIYQPSKDKHGEEFFVELCGRSIPARTTDDGIRAVSKDKELDPESVERYLSKAFGEDLDDVTTAMRDLAKAVGKGELNGRAFGLYEDFRPNVASGTRGWGQKGSLDVDGIRAIAKSKWHLNRGPCTGLRATIVELRSQSEI